MIQFILLFSRQGKLRLQKWYSANTLKDKKKITRDLTTMILSRKPKMCSFLEYKELKVVYKSFTGHKPIDVRLFQEPACFGVFAFLECLKSRHPNLKFIIEDEANAKLPSLDALLDIAQVENDKKFVETYASLFFCMAIEPDDNELICLEVIHRYVEVLDKYFGNVCELDIIFNFEKAYYVLDELILGGEVQETSKNTVIKAIAQQDLVQEDGEVPTLKTVLEEFGLS